MTGEADGAAGDEAGGGAAFLRWACCFRGFAAADLGLGWSARVAEVGLLTALSAAGWAAVGVTGGGDLSGGREAGGAAAALRLALALGVAVRVKRQRDH